LGFGFRRRWDGAGESEIARGVRRWGLLGSGRFGCGFGRGRRGSFGRFWGWSWTIVLGQSHHLVLSPFDFGYGGLLRRGGGIGSDGVKFGIVFGVLGWFGSGLFWGDLHEDERELLFFILFGLVLCGLGLKKLGDGRLGLEDGVENGEASDPVILGEILDGEEQDQMDEDRKSEGNRDRAFRVSEPSIASALNHCVG